MKSRLSDNDGAVLLVVLITIVLMMALIGGILTLASNQQRSTTIVSGNHIRSYYRANAGVVDARERIRRNITTSLSPAGSFLTAAYDPSPYYIDLADNSVHSGAQETGDDVMVDIGPRDVATGVRSIESTGLE